MYLCFIPRTTYTEASPKILASILLAVSEQVNEDVKGLAARQRLATASSVPLEQPVRQP